MSQNVKVGGTTYTGVESVKLPLAGGSGYATFTEETEPLYQEKTVTENGVVLPDSGYDALSKVTVNVASTGTLAEASGTITLTEDVSYLKVINLGFTPKAFRIVPVSGTVIADSTCGALYVRGSAVTYRTASGKTSINVINANTGSTDYTVRDDTYTPVSGGYCYIFNTGFGVSQDKAAFPFRSGMQFNWYAIGDVESEVS